MSDHRDAMAKLSDGAPRNIPRRQPKNSSLWDNRRMVILGVVVCIFLIGALNIMPILARATIINLQKWLGP